MRGRGVVLAAVTGVVLLLGMAAGLFLKGGGAKAGREYIAAEAMAGAKENEGENGGAGTDSGKNDGEIGTETELLQGKADNGAKTTGDRGQNPMEEQGDLSGQNSQGGQNGLGETAVDTGTGKPGEAPSSGIVMLFAGDVYLSDHVLNAYDRAGGIHGVLDEGIRAEIEKADVFMVNQEFPFTQRGTAAADKQFTFRLPESRMHILQEMGVDIVTLANNHILDFGPEGLLDSCKALDEAGILYVGGGEDFERASALETVTVGQKIIGFLGTSRVYMDAGWAAGKDHPGVFSTYDTTLPLKAIEEARQQCDFLVVYVHWGVERETEPKEYQRAMGKAYIDAGADLVVGSHPHVLQETEEYKGKTIVYSLGNFVFGSSIPSTALLKVEWGQDGTQVSMIPCTSSGGFTRLE